GYCNAKGRLHATFALVRMDKELYGAVLHRSVVAFVVKRLTMFRLRAKLAIEASERFVVIHHLSEPRTPAPRAPGARLALGNTRWVDISDETLSQRAAATPEDIGQWIKRGIEARQPEIVAETNEMFVPQMIGFDKLTPQSGVSFSKGCYPGQEVVARAHYRGAVKRELAVLRLPVAANVSPGAEYTREDTSVAEVVNVAHDGANLIALAVVPIAANSQSA
ncbi:MAG: YgfZ/GcvT domain-containing protein, partial [Casimicrobium sp.]